MEFFSYLENCSILGRKYQVGDLGGFEDPSQLTMINSLPYSLTYFLTRSSHFSRSHLPYIVCIAMTSICKRSVIISIIMLSVRFSPPPPTNPPNSPFQQPSCHHWTPPPWTPSSPHQSSPPRPPPTFLRRRNAIFGSATGLRGFWFKV